jgi:hypothetical protein
LAWRGSTAPQLGKQDNCQVAVTLSLATWEASLPVAWRLYLPREWAEDRVRRRRAGVPEEIEFQTKPEIALDQIARALDSGLPCGVVLADAGYGSDTRFRERLAEMGLQYGVGAEGSARELVIEMGQGALRRVAWREGSDRKLQSRFVAVRVRPAHRDYWRAEPHEELCPRPPARLGAKTRYSDEDLLAEIRRTIQESPFHGEGHRKVWARLRVREVRTSMRRVLRLMRENGLLAPQRQPQPVEPKRHDGTILAERPNQMWGIDATVGFTVAEGRVAIFAMVDHATAESRAFPSPSAARGSRRWNRSARRCMSSLVVS